MTSGTSDGGQMPRATDDARRLPLREGLWMRLEHAADAKGARVAAWLVRRSNGRIGRLWRRRVLVSATRGRRTGRRRSVPLQYFPDGETLVVVAANRGLSRPPAWSLNLTAAPPATVEVEGRTLDACAEELSNDEAAGFWPRVLEAAPDYARYPKRTSRRIPLVRLVPVEQSQVPAEGEHR